MAKSIIAAALLLLTPGVARAEPVTAEQAMRRYREVVKPTAELDCPRDPDAIVVCARPKDVPDPHRLPLPVAPTPGARVAGDAPRASAGASEFTRYCFARCEGIVGVDLDMAIKAVNGLKRLIEGDE